MRSQDGISHDDLVGRIVYDVDLVAGMTPEQDEQLHRTVCELVRDIEKKGLGRKIDLTRLAFSCEAHGGFTLRAINSRDGQSVYEVSCRLRLRITLVPNLRMNRLSLKRWATNRQTPR